MSNRCLILGVGGMDGSYLAELLLSKGCEVHGLHRRSSSDNLWRLDINGVRSKVCLHQGDVTDPYSLDRVIGSVELDEVYNFADQDHVGWSFSLPYQALDVTLGGCVRVLETVKRLCPDTKVLQPLSATMFGDTRGGATDLDPRSPYAAAKAACINFCSYYHFAGVDVRCATFFNHDSPRRSGEYLLHKIARQAVAAKATGDLKVKMGNLDLRVDVGHAAEYVAAAWTAMQLPRSGRLQGWAVSTGIGVTLKRLVWDACRHVGIEPAELTIEDDGWSRGDGPSELVGSDAFRELPGWKPTKTAIDVVRELVDHYSAKEVVR